MAFAVKEEAGEKDLICPMIDARRMEVFTAVYDRSLHTKIPAHALVLEKNSFEDLLKDKKILFFGDGSPKFQSIISNPYAYFTVTIADARHLVELSYQLFSVENFADLAYAEPFYIKEFHTNR